MSWQLRFKVLADRLPWLEISFVSAEIPIRRASWISIKSAFGKIGKRPVLGMGIAYPIGRGHRRQDLSGKFQG